MAVCVLAALGTIVALHFARAFLVPLLIGILASYALRPLVDWLQAMRIPRPAGAALVIGVLAGGLLWIAFSLSDDAAAMLEKLPEAARKLRQDVNALGAQGPTPLQKVQEAASELEKAAAEAAGAAPPGRPAAPPPPVSSAWLRDFALTQSALLITGAAQTPVVVLLTYFLLASGQHFRRKLVGFAGPSLSQKKVTVEILQEIDSQIQHYLFAMLASNTLIALITWLAFELLGVEQAGVWGVSAGVLHFIPYLGPAMIALASAVAGYAQFGSMLDALVVAGTSMLIAGAIGMVFMTWLQSRFARLNAAVLFIALLFFGWLWGVWGLLLGAPLLAIARAICDRVDALKPVGELLGR